MQPDNQTPLNISVPQKPIVPTAPTTEATSSAPPTFVPSSHIVLDSHLGELLDEPALKSAPIPHKVIAPSPDATAVISAAVQVPPLASQPTAPAAQSQHEPIPFSLPNHTSLAPSLPSSTPPPLSRAEQTALLAKDLVDLNTKKEALRAEIATISVEQKKEAVVLAPILKKISDLEEAHAALEASEANATTPAEKRKFEEERFALEGKRQAALLEKFSMMEKTETITDTVAQKEAIYQSIVEEESALKTRIHEFEVAAERKTIHDELEGVVKSRTAAEAQCEAVKKEKAAIEALLIETQAKEQSIEETEHATAAQMSTATTLKSERALADERAKLEKERHEVETARWSTEDSLAAIAVKEGEAIKALEVIKAHEAELFAKLQALK